MIQSFVRSGVRIIANFINKHTKSAITPNMVTLFGLFMHTLVAYCIINGDRFWAAGLLVFFGLFDTLDGELARLQKRVSNAGAVLDASSDRIKEIILYSAVAYSFTATDPLAYTWVVLACSSSLLVSYVKAKGETVVKHTKRSTSEINRLFSNGLMRFEVRIATLVLGLLFDKLLAAIIFIAIGSLVTALYRLVKVVVFLNKEAP